MLKYPKGKIMKVVVVDDSPIVRARLIQRLNEIFGVTQSMPAGDPIEAEQLIKDCSPDLVILDIRMPELSGIELLKRVKEFDPTIIVIILTNYPYPQYKEQAYQVGADYFFSKSDEFEEVFTTITNLAEVG